MFQKSFIKIKFYFSNYFNYKILSIFKNFFENKTNTSHMGTITTNVFNELSGNLYEISHPCLILNKDNIKSTCYSFTHNSAGIPCSNKNQFFTEVINAKPNQINIQNEAPQLLTYQLKFLEFAYFIQTKNQIIYNNDIPLTFNNKNNNLIQRIDEEYKFSQNLVPNNEQIKEKTYLKVFDYFPELTTEDKSALYNTIIDNMKDIPYNNFEITEKALKLKKFNNNELSIEHFKNTVIFQEKINKLNAIWIDSDKLTSLLHETLKSNTQ